MTSVRTPWRLLLLATASASICGAAASVARAQTAPDATPATHAKRAASSHRHAKQVGAGSQGEDITVRVGGHDQTGVLPTRPTSTTFGLALRPEDTPRTVTTVTSTQLQHYSIRTTADLTTLVPGAYTASFYGEPSVPDIRGTLADLYWGGFKRIENDGTFPLPIEASSSLDVVSGPASPMFGAGKIGGFVNYLPKSYEALSLLGTDKQTGDLSAMMGSYNAFRQTGDYGRGFEVAGKPAAFEVFAENDLGSDYYHGIRARSKIFQADLAFEPAPNWQVNLNSQFYDTRGAYQNPGWNRVTQDLIDSSSYTAGSPISSYVHAGQAFATDAELSAHSPTNYVLPAYGVNPTVSSYSELNPATVKQVTISPRDVNVSGDDVGNANTFTNLGEISHEFADGSQAKFQLFEDDANVEQYTSYGFGKWIQSWTSEARASYINTFHPTPWLSFNNDVGVGYRYYDSHEKYEYGAGNLNTDQRDLSKAADADEILNPIYKEPGLAWDQDFRSVEQDTGVFLNSRVNIFDHLHLLLGARWDYYNVTAINTGLVSFNVPTNTRYTAHENDPSYNLSVTYDLPYGLKPYFTYAHEYTLSTQQFGGIDPGDIAGQSYITPSELVEAGLKGTVDDHLYYALSVYRQRYTQVDSYTDGVFGTIASGIEAQIRLALTKNFSITATGNDQKTWINGSTTLIATPQELGYTGYQLYGSLVELPTDGISTLKNGFIDHSLPNHVISVYANYDVAEHWGATFGGTYTSNTRSELPGGWTNPGYLLLNLSAHYQWRRYKAEVSITNLADQRYFVPFENTDKDEMILPGEGRMIYGTFSVKL